MNLYEDNLYQLQNWLKNQNIDFYYMQCYDKTTVFEEGYPQGVVRHETEHLGENTEKYIVQKGRVNIVPLHETIKAAKEQNIYLKYTDWCHWNEAGMYLVYKKLMEKIGEKYHILACMKHFAGYGYCVGGRDYNEVEMSMPTLHNVFLPSFKAGIDAGAATVMTAYHTLNGVPCTGSKYLMTDVLRGECGFEGG